MNKKQPITTRIRKRITVHRSLLSILFVAFLLTGCKNVIIEEPQQNSVHSDTPSEFRIKFSESADLSELTVLLNGSDVSDSFEIIDGFGYATGESLNEYSVSGQNIIEVEKPSGALPTLFIIDREGPVAHITFVEGTTNLTIEGYVEDDIGIESLSVNGIPVTLDANNDFSINVEKTITNSAFDIVTFDAVDLFGRESSTTYAHPALPEKSAMLPNTLSVSLTDFGINYLIDNIAEPLIETLDLTNGLNNSELASINGSVGYASVVLNSVTHGTPNLSLDTLARAESGAIRTEVGVPTITISVTASAGTHPIITPDIPGVDLPWPLPDIPPINIPDIPGTNINVTASPTLNNVRYQTTANLFLVNNVLDVSLTDSSLLLGSFDLSAFSALNSIFSQLNFSLANVLENFIEDAIENELPGLMPDIIAPLWVETDSQGDISGKLFGTDVDVSKLITQEDSFDFTLDTNIVPLSLDGIPDALGSVYNASTLPSLDGTTPNGESYHAAVVISEALINQTLLAAHYNGLTHVTVSAEASELGGIDNIDVLSLESGDTILLSIAPLEPSAVAFDEIDGAMLDLSVPLMNVSISKKRGDVISPLLSGTATLSAPMEFFFKDGKSLSTKIEGIPEVSFSSLVIGESIQLPTGLPQALLDYLIVKTIPSLTAGIDIIPLPEFSGYRIGSPTMWLTDGNPAFLVVAGDLEKTN